MYSSLNSGGLSLNLSKANITGMDLERHPLYRRAEQIFQLTRGSLGWPSRGPRKALKIAVFGAALSLIPVLTTAQEAPKEAPPDHALIILSAADCRTLVAYTDTAAAAYRPGVDVRGRPVAGANVADQNPGLIPDVITFTLSLRLGDFAPNVAAGLADSSPPIGEIAVREKEVFLNGQSLNVLQTEAFATQCQHHIEARELD